MTRIGRNNRWVYFDPDMYRQCIEEFAQSQGNCAEYDILDVIPANGFKGQRFVFLIEGNGQKFALKYDSEAVQTGRLKREFETLHKVYTYFQACHELHVVRPRFLSKGGDFFVMDMVDAPTVLGHILTSGRDERLTDVFQQMGSWLNHMHGLSDVGLMLFRPRRIMMTLNDPEMAENGYCKVDKSSPEMQYLAREIPKLRGVLMAMGQVHGDSHGNNFLITPNGLTGLDITKMRMGSLLSDIIKALMVDLEFDSKPSEINRFGVIRDHFDAFFGKYSHEISDEVLRFAVIATLVKRKAAITRQGYEGYALQRRRFHEIEKRLAILDY